MVAVQFKVCSRSIAGIAGSNSAEGMDVRLLFFVVCCVGSNLCAELITRSEEFYRLCVCVCVCVWSRNLNNEAAWAPAGL
jgi:hypothetical protein